MSEWERDDSNKSVGFIRGYERGLLLGMVGARFETPDTWLWSVHDEYALETPGGTAGSAEAAMKACDEAAVAWVLIALVKRAARWVDEVDAKLAREYRAARLAYETATRSDGYDYRPEHDEQERARRSIVLGWPAYSDE